MDAGRTIVRRYYLAMAVPFVIDLMTSVIYAAINAEIGVLPPMVAVSTAFLVVGAWGRVLPDPPCPALHGGGRSFQRC